MSVDEKPARWSARDGREFPTKAEAEAHDELVKLRDEHADATRRLGIALARRELTKDGHPFEMQRFSDYFRIVEPHGQAPRIQRVDAPWGSWGFEWDNRGELEICEPRGSSLHDRPQRIRISELYAKESNAVRDLIERREVWLTDHIRHLEEMRDKTGTTPEPVTFSIFASEANTLALANAFSFVLLMFVGMKVSHDEGPEGMRRIDMTVRPLVRALEE